MLKGYLIPGFCPNCVRGHLSPVFFRILQRPVQLLLVLRALVLGGGRTAGGGQGRGGKGWRGKTTWRELGDASPKSWSQPHFCTLQHLLCKLITLTLSKPSQWRDSSLTSTRSLLLQFFTWVNSKEFRQVDGSHQKPAVSFWPQRSQRLKTGWSAFTGDTGQVIQAWIYWQCFRGLLLTLGSQRFGQTEVLKGCRAV